MNKLEELKFSQFFIDRFNQYHARDFRVFPNEHENTNDPDIDVYVKSDTHGTFTLQLREGNPELKALWPKLRKEARATGKSVVGGTVIMRNIHEAAIAAIDAKENKYAPAQKKQMVLLIQDPFGTLLDQQFARFSYGTPPQTQFKGIYAVKLPTTPEFSSHPQDGQVVAIYDVYGKHGETF